MSKFNPCIDYCYIRFGRQFSHDECYGKCEFADACREKDYYEKIIFEGIYKKDFSKIPDELRDYFAKQQELSKE